MNNAVIGGVVGAITGAALVRLLAKQRPFRPAAAGEG
jgi:hypothetical protein